MSRGEYVTNLMSKGGIEISSSKGGVHVCLLNGIARPMKWSTLLYYLQKDSILQYL